MTGSLVYRNNQAAILAGKVPEKYTRLLPHIPGARHILEVGSAEGVLALLLARSGKQVTALEMREDRHDAAVDLARTWGVPHGITFVHGRIDERLDLMDGQDTLIAVRMIYYLRESIDAVFSEAAKRVRNVVLCGNRNRADAWRRGVPHAPLGEFNRYAAREGMRDLLERHGYRISEEAADGDEIVVGVLD